MNNLATCFRQKELIIVLGLTPITTPLILEKISIMQTIKTKKYFCIISGNPHKSKQIVKNLLFSNLREIEDDIEEFLTRYFWFLDDPNCSLISSLLQKDMSNLFDLISVCSIIDSQTYLYKVENASHPQAAVAK